MKMYNEGPNFTIIAYDISEIEDMIVFVDGRRILENSWKESKHEVKADMLYNALRDVKNAEKELDLAKAKLEKIRNIAVMP